MSCKRCIRFVFFQSQITMYEKTVRNMHFFLNLSKEEFAKIVSVLRERVDMQLIATTNSNSVSDPSNSCDSLAGVMGINLSALCSSFESPTEGNANSTETSIDSILNMCSLFSDESNIQRLSQGSFGSTEELTERVRGLCDAANKGVRKTMTIFHNSIDQSSNSKLNESSMEWDHATLAINNSSEPPKFCSPSNTLEWDELSTRTDKDKIRYSAYTSSEDVSKVAIDDSSEKQAADTTLEPHNICSLSIVLDNDEMSFRTADSQSQQTSSQQLRIKMPDPPADDPEEVLHLPLELNASAYGNSINVVDTSGSHNSSSPSIAFEDDDLSFRTADNQSQPGPSQQFSFQMPDLPDVLPKNDFKLPLEICSSTLRHSINKIRASLAADRSLDISNACKTFHSSELNEVSFKSAEDQSCQQSLSSQQLPIEIFGLPIVMPEEEFSLPPEWLLQVDREPSATSRPFVDTHHCQYCQKTFRRAAILATHLKSGGCVKKHSPPKYEFKCSVCAKCFERKSKWRQHTQTHSKKSRNKPKLVCPCCDAFYSSKAALVGHTRRKHLKI